jgi:hypothetical protein
VLRRQRITSASSLSVSGKELVPSPVMIGWWSVRFLRRSVRGEYQIGGPTLCASARVTVLTLCPLGEPEIAIGQEPRIEPWLPRNRIACPVSRIDRRSHHEKMKPREPKSNPEKNLSNDREAYLQTVGWISRQKSSRLPAEGEAFLLTSPFIEPPISRCDRCRKKSGLAGILRGQLWHVRKNREKFRESP